MTPEEPLITVYQIDNTSGDNAAPECQCEIPTRTRWLITAISVASMAITAGLLFALYWLLQ